MDAPRPSGLGRALQIVLILAALAGAAFLAMGRDEPPVPKARPASAEPTDDDTPQRRGPPPAEPPAPTPAATAAPRASEAPPDSDPEARFIERMRAALTSDPEEVLRLDDAATREFGDSPRAAERGQLRVRALVRLDRIGEARSLAEDLIERYPDDPAAKSAAAYMGIHPRPRGPSR
ncbi:tetratricopeptide repeat protein [Sorangium sp. So ce1335]|uniref:tetratricopeptide repeat protein n=1 Tax=Sorangium sp. So ce1335 TaxID=3133335 RepID=UPI003F636EFF